MGKRLYESFNISPERTKQLGIQELAVLSQSDDEFQYRAVSQNYFSKGKTICPTCGGRKTRVSKIVTRKLKDILPVPNEKGRVIDLTFDQRYYKCLDCGNRVFPENISFAEPGCRYSNRLSDLLAEGTLTHSYSKVCAYYGVPASKTSVGVIMRRIFRQRLEKLPPIKTPITLSVFLVEYFGYSYPVIMNIADDGVYFVDILEESSEEAYQTFFSQFEANEVQHIFADADEQLVGALSVLFPQAKIVMTDECLLRYVKNAFSEIINDEGKYCGVPRRINAFTSRKQYLATGEKRRVGHALETRPRLRAAYNAYQDLLNRIESPWTVNTILQWIDQLPEYLADETPDGETLPELQEFDIVKTILEMYKPLFEDYLSMDNKPPANYASCVSGIADAVASMPCCIYEVLRARMTLNSPYKTEAVNSRTYRIGISVDVLIQSTNAITNKIMEERDNDGYQSENSASWH